MPAGPGSYFINQTMTVSQENYKQRYGEIFHCSKADKEEK